MISNKFRSYILLGISVAVFVAMLFSGPIKQDAHYHFFADARSMHDVPNFWNVVTNFPFIVIGLLGVITVAQSRPNDAFKELIFCCYVFFIGIFFTGIGSAYYHWFPTNQTLVWDRLPMTISFMAFFSLLIGDTISLKAGKQILWPMILIGFMSIIYWTTLGDLRLYVLVQFLPVILTPIILLLYRSQTNSAKYFWMMIVFYAFAKVFESCDHQTFYFCGISGHSIKHLFAALAPVSLIFALRKDLKNSFW
jgi:hypothetical protein